jgi:glucan endo-1,3-alpha-glucosidase
LNIAANDYEVDRINDAYPVAESKGFKFFYSFDMSYSWSEDDMVNIVAAHANSSATYLYDGDVLVSTYAGSNYGNDFWTGFKSSLASRGIAVKLAPAFTDYRDPSLTSQLLSSFPSIDGFFNWWSW